MSGIRDVARLAHVSPATVSRVLNNNQTYRITDETRKNVLKAAAELGYKALVKKPSPSHTADSRELSVGCLLATTRGKYSDPYYLSILGGIEEELKKAHGVISIVQTEQELDDPAVLDRVLNAGLDGLVMMRPLNEPLFQLLYSRIPHIVGIDTGHAAIDNIEYDHFEVSRMAVEYLYHKGHRQVGYIGGFIKENMGSAPRTRSRRYRGYRDTMNELGLEIRPEWVLDCEWDDKLCMKLVENTCHTCGLPTSFYVGSDLMAMAALRALYQMGLSVPGQVAVIGMSNIEMSQYANPPLTTIDVPSAEMGIAAARMLVARIHGDATLPKRILLPSKLIERNSV